MKEFNVLKKNRKYFAASLDGYKCRILIDELSQNLSIGTQRLDVEDISVRSKYGTDLIFKLKSSVEEQNESGFITLTSTYNTYLVDKCRALGGQWDKSSECWVFSGLIEEKVDELACVFNSHLVPVEVTINDDYDVYEEKGTLCCLGYPIARAFGRDSGARVEEGVGVVAGGFTSCGSKKNWVTQAKSGTVFRIEVAEKVLTHFAEKEPHYHFKAI
ncbi:hypothetical protein [Vibrio parahaemolyticus]|uniref:hypothetical protein n=1 Tax=Vibrio parahaemolyticus TaxID=670 RepID=UPI00235E7CB2|nr:hypothetical protein [Vibrio parahaemolyticus]HDU8572077.1 hypothetical protein [Vibrio parahaemolyticus]